MPCPHNEISIVQRSHRQSAVAAAAYQSGEKLFCEYDQQVKHYPPSLQGGGCFPFPERYRPTSTPPLYGISAASSLFPKECAWILPSMTKGTETHTPMSC